MELDDRAANVEPHPHAFGLGGEERGEQPAAAVLVEAVTAVDHRDFDRPRSAGAHPHHQQALVGQRLGHGVEAVADQVQQHLLDHDAVGEHRRQAGGDVWTLAMATLARDSAARFRAWVRLLWFAGYAQETWFARERVGGRALPAEVR